jgi:hypothetical protein
MWGQMKTLVCLQILEGEKSFVDPPYTGHCKPFKEESQWTDAKYEYIFVSKMYLDVG